MNDEEYSDILISQAKNSSKPGIHAYLTWLYKEIEFSLKGNFILEVGAGAGLSSNFMSLKKVVRTDYLPWKIPGIQGAIDAQQLPFSDNSFDSAFALDAVHHIPNPGKAISELCRVVRPGGKIVIVEPFVSYLSFFPYKLFHTEKTTWNYSLPTNGVRETEGASDGEQAVLQGMIDRNLQIKGLEIPESKRVFLTIRYISPFSFFATGGLGSPFPTPKSMIDVMIGIERLLPRLLMKLISARQILVIDIQPAIEPHT